MLNLCLIYARSENYCIGKAGKVPWHLPDEYAHFKRTTLGKPIIMGRKTYEDHESLLPGRMNLVVTQRSDYVAAPGVEVVPSFASALARASEVSEEVFVVGGAGLLATSFASANRVYETVVHTHVEAGDTFLPVFDFTGWRRTLLERHAVDERHAFAYTALSYERTTRV